MPLGFFRTGFLCTLLASPGAQLLSLLFRLGQVPGPACAALPWAGPRDPALSPTLSPTLTLQDTHRPCQAQRPPPRAAPSAAAPGEPAPPAGEGGLCLSGSGKWQREESGRVRAGGSGTDLSRPIRPSVRPSISPRGGGWPLPAGCPGVTPRDIQLHLLCLRAFRGSGPRPGGSILAARPESQGGPCGAAKGWRDNFPKGRALPGAPPRSPAPEPRPSCDVPRPASPHSGPGSRGRTPQARTPPKVSTGRWLFSPEHPTGAHPGSRLGCGPALRAGWGRAATSRGWANTPAARPELRPGQGRQVRQERRWAAEGGRGQQMLPELGAGQARPQSLLGFSGTSCVCGSPPGTPVPELSGLHLPDQGPCPGGDANAQARVPGPLSPPHPGLAPPTALGGSPPTGPGSCPDAGVPSRWLGGGGR